ncbi:uncharacterized protein Bfra_008532 [Botrytis fragariae]|uniref:Uncharacterized protein n=1 Tax=Botrytis fragariae TaxID=1964551 RepID=A0A8H6AT10_9HELO|nr:uncharacterized protein Bfra_008532 [Botrytis fragariae]KAF5873251.1 hypothetical protein Bfra_008532 [Botrytis fragariae]
MKCELRRKHCTDQAGVGTGLVGIDGFIWSTLIISRPREQGAMTINLDNIHPSIDPFIPSFLYSNSIAASSHPSESDKKNQIQSNIALKLPKLKNASAHVAMADITSLMRRATITTLGPITGINPRNQRHGIPKTETCSDAMP